MALAHLYAIRTPICSQLKSSLNNPLRVALATKSARTRKYQLYKPAERRAEMHSFPSYLPTTFFWRRETFFLFFPSPPLTTSFLKLSGAAQQLLPSSHRSQVVTTRAMSSSAMKDMVNQKIKENPIIVMSKSYCPYCTQVKSLFKELKVPAKVIELDQLADGDDVQDGLTEISKMRTFPQVFIKGALVGGCDGACADFVMTRNHHLVYIYIYIYIYFTYFFAFSLADTMAAYRSGQLKTLLEGVGVSI